MYSSKERSLVAIFFQAELKNLIETFSQWNPRRLTSLFSRENYGGFAEEVRRYAEESGRWDESVTELLSTEHALDNELLWKQYSEGIAYEVRRRPRAMADTACASGTVADLPGIPLKEENVGMAQNLLQLPYEVAKLAIRPVIPSGSSIFVDGYSRPLYHETVHSKNGLGVKNINGIDVITFFYVKKDGEYYLVAWGTHIAPKHGNPQYKIQHQIPQISTQLSRQILHF